jgi:hypothetical protein
MTHTDLRADRALTLSPRHEPAPTGLPQLSWRPATPEDLPACLAICPPDSFGVQELGQDTVLHLWTRLIATPATTCTAVIEANLPIHGSRLVGFGLASFIAEDIAVDAIARPRPWLNRRIMEAILAGRSPVLSPQELRRDNTLEGLNLLTLSGYIRPACEDDVELMRRISMLLASAFYEAHRGFRLRRILFEVTEQALRQRLHRVQIYRLREYPQTQPGVPRTGLVAIDEVSAYEHEHSLFGMLFNYTVPRLRLSPAEQCLLEVAIHGLTDRELVERLGLSMEAVRSRWRTVLRKAAGLLRERGLGGEAVTGDDPDEVAGDGEPGRRGPQQRHHLLDYLREHREELRPFDWSLWDSRHGGTAAP